MHARLYPLPRSTHMTFILYYCLSIDIRMRSEPLILFSLEARAGAMAAVHALLLLYPAENLSEDTLRRLGRRFVSAFPSLIFLNFEPVPQRAIHK